MLKKHINFARADTSIYIGLCKFFYKKIHILPNQTPKLPNINLCIIVSNLSTTIVIM